jgi:hypothetical protein
MKKLEPVHFSHLPVWSEGNVYLAGAKACKNEVGGLVLDSDVKVELVEKDGRCYLDTNIYDLLKDFTVPMVHTDTLGKAFEPAQKFQAIQSIIVKRLKEHPNAICSYSGGSDLFTMCLTLIKTGIRIIIKSDIQMLMRCMD